LKVLKKPRICFVAPQVYPLLAEGIAMTAGGAELQQVFIARALARAGYEVCVLSWDYGQANEVQVEGITVRKITNFERDQSSVRRALAIWKALSSADAQVYYQRCAGYMTGIVATFARLKGKRFIYAIAHDLDVQPERMAELLNRTGGWRDKKLFSFGLRLADVIVAQHPGQVAACTRWLDRRAVHIPSCYPNVPTTAKVGGYVLWVGTLRKWKRPELFLQLAESLPQIHFRMVGGPAEGEEGQAHFELLKAKANQLKNLDFVGFVPPQQIDAHFDGARVFINTSTDEGFPNTFLQSWARGVPTISFIECYATEDGYSINTRCEDLSEMTNALVALYEDMQLWSRQSARVKRYVENYHSIERSTELYRAAIRGCVSTYRNSSD
jgi:glycosyltransferase involved in cell wall biosynthesis